LSLHDDILTSLRRIIRATDQHSRRLMQRHGLTAPQLIVLRILSQGGECSVGTLAERVNLAQPTVTGVLGRLERRGLVSRTRSRFDRRRVLANLTADGRALLSSAPPPLQETFLARLRELQDWERSLILSSLQRVVHMMEAESIEASPLLVSGPIHETGSRAVPEPPTESGAAS
jgi:DNA-binding MarR family transcriptional regulator